MCMFVLFVVFIRYPYTKQIHDRQSNAMGRVSITYIAELGNSFPGKRPIFLISNCLHV